MFNFNSGHQWNNIAQISRIKQKNEALQSLLTITLCFNRSFARPSAYLKETKKVDSEGGANTWLGGVVTWERNLCPLWHHKGLISSADTLFSWVKEVKDGLSLLMSMVSPWTQIRKMKRKKEIRPCFSKTARGEQQHLFQISIDWW